MTCLGRLTISGIRFSVSKVPVLPEINPTGIRNKSANCNSRPLLCSSNTKKVIPLRWLKHSARLWCVALPQFRHCLEENTATHSVVTISSLFCPIPEKQGGL